MTYLLLFLEFFKTGLFSIGGGLATLPFLYEMAGKYPWFTTDTLTDMIAVSESTPGAIGVNMATYAGFEAGSVLGSFIATGALVLPSVIIIILVSKMLDKFKSSKYVQYSFYGLRPAVTGLIAAAGYQIFQIAVLDVERFQESHNLMQLVNWQNSLFFIIILFLVMKFKKHPIVYIFIGAVAGVIFSL